MHCWLTNEWHLGRASCLLYWNFLFKYHFKVIIHAKWHVLLSMPRTCPFGIIREKAPTAQEQQRKCINTKTPKKYKTRKEGPVTRRTDAKDVELEGASWLRSGKRKRISLEWMLILNIYKPASSDFRRLWLATEARDIHWFLLVCKTQF